MAKIDKDTKLTDGEWEILVRNLIQTVAQLATRNPGAAAKLARSTNLSKSAITQMKRTGKASTVSFIRVAAFLAGLADEQAKGLLENPAAILKNLDPASDVDKLFNEVRVFYSDNELAAWLILLKSKHKVESDLGISLNAHVIKSNSKKNRK